MRRLLCRIGWHSWPNFAPAFHDGASQHAICRWCGGVGMVDSQGNLFNVSHPSAQADDGGSNG